MEAPNPNSQHENKDAISSPQREKWCITEYIYSYNGFWFILPYLEATLRILQGFKPHPKDVILASFPKSGTTWLKALLHCILHRSHNNSNNNKSLMNTHPQHLVHSLETHLYLVEGCEARKQSQDGERTFGTHLPYQIIGEVLSSSECKVVYVTRNPKDALISLWHFVKKSGAFEVDPWDLETAVDQFCKGAIPFGPYYEHVLRYREESLKRPDKVLFLTYEELKEDPKKQVVRIAEFLGRPFEREGESEEIVKLCSFESLTSLKVNKSKEVPYGGFPMPYDSFFRTGEVGDYKNYLKDDMVERIDALTRKKFHGNGFEYGT